jgi:hypothetical protein
MHEKHTEEITVKSKLFTMTGLLLTSLLGAASVCAPGAQASFIVTIEQVGANVVVTGSGSLDLAGMSYQSGTFAESGIQPNAGSISIGSPNYDPVDYYKGSISGPSRFGTGGVLVPSDSGSGDKVTLGGETGDYLSVPTGYVSGDPLSDSETFDNATFASLGLTVGDYTWTLPSDSYTIEIGAVTAPEPASLTLLAAGVGMTLLAARRRRRSAV